MPASLSVSASLDRLRMPEKDVRQSRPEEGVRSLAQSMGDPDVGQLQPIYVHPHPVPEDPGEWTQDDLQDYHRGEGDLQVVDGVTRWRAAEKLGWSDIWAVLLPKPPENTVIASLDANTERLEMGEFETVKAISDYKQESGATWSEVAEEVGYSVSYLSRISSALDGPDYLVEAWRDPDSPLETGHVLDLMGVTSSATIEDLQEWGDMTEEAARSKVENTQRLLAKQAIKHQYTVSQLRDRIERKMAEVRREVTDSRSVAEKQMDGQASTAQAAEAAAQEAAEDPDPCTLCGDPSVTRKAVPVCQEDYGLLSQAVENEDPLFSDRVDRDGLSGDTDDLTDVSRGEMVQALEVYLGTTQEGAETVLEKLEEMAHDGPTPTTD